MYFPWNLAGSVTMRWTRANTTVLLILVKSK